MSLQDMPRWVWAIPVGLSVCTGAVLVISRPEWAISATAFLVLNISLLARRLSDDLALQPTTNVATES